MDFGVYSVFDSKSAIYDRVWQAVSDPAAIRSFTDIALDATHPIGMHPEDYSLFKVGTWSDESGEFVNEAPPQLMAKAHEILRVRSKVEEATQAVRSVGDA